MCIWNTPVEDRHCEFCSYWGGCEKRPVEPVRNCTEVATEYLAIMYRITGLDIMTPSRRREVSWGRYMVIYLLHKAGFSWIQIGKAIGLNRVTAMYGAKNVTKMLQMPAMYPKEMDVWKELIKNI